MNPLDELKSLDRQIDEIRELAALKPIFYRLDEIAKLNADDFEVQLAASEVKQRIIARGTTLRALGQTMQGMPAATPTSTGLRPEAPPVPKQDQAFQPFSTAPYPLPTQPFPSGDQQSPPPLGSSFEQGAGSTFETNVPPSDFNADPNARTSPLRPMAPPRTEAPFPVPRNVKSGSGNSMKGPLLMGGLIGLLIAAGLIAFLVNRSRAKTVATTAVPLAVLTEPDGASIRVNGEVKCVSNCSVAVRPGDYQVTAFLDGYEPAAGNVHVTAKQPAELSLTLAPQSPSVRIVSDVLRGKVTVDDQPAVDLQDGQFVLDKVAAGTHRIKVSSADGAEASFSVETAGAALPKVSGPMAVKDFSALLVSTLGSHARAVTNAPAKLALNGQPQVDVGPDGADLGGFKPGVGEFALGDGASRKTMSETFGPAPALTVFLKADVSIGTLIVSTGEDDARVFLNGKEYARKTKKGELRIQTLGSVAVRVAKDGFDVAPPQNADVKRGAETRLAFRLTAIPKVAALQIRGATPGADILIDQQPVGKVGDDGNFTANAVVPGDHLIEVRKDQFVAKRFQRPFQAGLAVNLAGADVVLSSALGTVRVTRAPADAQISYRRNDEAQLHDLRVNQVDLPPGTYIFQAHSPGFADKTERVQVALGEARTVELSLARVAVAPPPAPKTGGMSDFDDPNAWSKQGDLWVHKGAGFIPFRLPANGTFTFTVRLLKGGSLFRGGKIRWAVQYIDPKNYALFEMDRKTLSSKVLEEGKNFDRDKFAHGLSDKEMAYTIQIDAAPGQLIHRVKNGDQWTIVDTWKEPGRNFAEGKFGFLVQGNDEIGLADFKFVPR